MNTKPKINKKHDCTGVRTPADVERKYNLGSGYQSKEMEERANQIALSLNVLEKKVNLYISSSDEIKNQILTDIESIRTNVSELYSIKANKNEVYSRSEMDLIIEGIKLLIPGYEAVAILDESLLDACTLA